MSKERTLREIINWIIHNASMSVDRKYDDAIADAALSKILGLFKVEEKEIIKIGKSIFYFDGLPDQWKRFAEAMSEYLNGRNIL